MGLPGSGKTTLACALVNKLSINSTVLWLNADEQRQKYHDWDFSIEGRLRQAKRLSSLSVDTQYEYIVCDFIAPYREQRDIFDADYIIWMDTISEGRFDDTNVIFDPPNEYNYVINTHNKTKDTNIIIDDLLNK